MHDANTRIMQEIRAPCDMVPACNHSILSGTSPAIMYSTLVDSAIPGSVADHTLRANSSGIIPTAANKNQKNFRQIFGTTASVALRQVLPIEFQKDSRPPVPCSPEECISEPLHESGADTIEENSVPGPSTVTELRQRSEAEHHLRELSSIASRSDHSEKKKRLSKKNTTDNVKEHLLSKIVRVDSVARQHSGSQCRPQLVCDASTNSGISSRMVTRTDSRAARPANRSYFRNMCNDPSVCSCHHSTRIELYSQNIVGLYTSRLRVCSSILHKEEGVQMRNVLDALAHLFFSYRKEIISRMRTMFRIARTMLRKLKRFLWKKIWNMLRR